MHFKKDRLPLKKKKRRITPKYQFTIFLADLRIQQQLKMQNQNKQKKPNTILKKILKKPLKTNKTKSQPQITNLVYYFQTLMYVYLSLLFTQQCNVANFPQNTIHCAHIYMYVRKSGLINTIKMYRNLSIHMQ